MLRVRVFASGLLVLVAVSHVQASIPPVRGLDDSNKTVRSPRVGYVSASVGAPGRLDSWSFPEWASLTLSGMGLLAAASIGRRMSKRPSQSAH